MVLTSWFGTGTRNIKHETLANNVIDQNACIGSERTGGALIKPGETLNKDGFWHKCTHYPKNQTAVYTEESGCMFFE
ncbi:unnamed protein product [Gongylonema pulchrum]|uniref:Beta_helix domain-containing protein n=1 Tax=Gongylonema pulchrum TaxID=637853 RepID=A0A183EUJ5_9BILA|nr:unnamed protein product [Gongylonema pulchrum]